MGFHVRNTYAILSSGIAIAAAVLIAQSMLGFISVNYQPQQQQQQQQQQTADAAIPPQTKTTSNISDASTNIIVQQGTVSSMPPMGPTDTLRIAPILNPRPDGSVYTGTLTYTASKKVDILVAHKFGISNSSLLNSTYLEPENFPAGPGLQVAPSVIEPNYGNSFIYSASIPFSGNALGVMTFNSQPFIVTYSLKATIDKPIIINNVTNALVKTILIPPGAVKVSIVPNAPAIANKAYQPNPIKAKLGGTVAWTNNDVETHTVTSGSGPNDPNLGKQFDSGLIGPKQTFAQTFKTVGEFSYFCQIHPAMIGKVLVK